MSEGVRKGVGALVLLLVSVWIGTAGLGSDGEGEVSECRAEVWSCVMCEEGMHSILFSSVEKKRGSWRRA